MVHGHRQAIVFTQYTDTLEYIRGYLGDIFGEELACYSGRGGEQWDGVAKTWRRVTKDAIKADFLGGDIRILLCTDAASEGLNLQSAALLFNYDMPWNPMRVEQRIGRIDRIGQPSAVVEIVNYYYEGTIEADIYRTLRQRINIFSVVVGPLQPILSTVGSRIEAGIQAGQSTATIVQGIEAEIDRAEREGVDIEAYAASGVTQHFGAHPLPLTPDDIDVIVRESHYISAAGYVFTPDPLRPGVYILHTPGGADQAVTLLPHMADRFPETVRYLTYLDDMFTCLMNSAPPLETGTSVERVEKGAYVAYVSSTGEAMTLASLRVALGRSDVVPEEIVASAAARLTLYDRAAQATADSITRRRTSARRAIARDILSAYLSLVAREVQIPSGTRVDASYLLMKARGQDRDLLHALFETAGRPDEVDVSYDESDTASASDASVALGAQRQQAQRFLMVEAS